MNILTAANEATRPGGWRRRWIWYVAVLMTVTVLVAGVYYRSYRAKSCLLRGDSAWMRRQLHRYGDGVRMYAYPEALAVWHAEVEKKGLCERSLQVETGTCNQGTLLYISRSGGFTGQEYYFDATTGAFRSLVTWTDVIDSECEGQSWWPLRLSLSGFVPTADLCRGERAAARAPAH